MKPKIDPEQLRRGIAVEKEHHDLFEKLLRQRVSEREFYAAIARAHLREIPDYYDRLAVMEHHYFKS